MKSDHCTENPITSFTLDDLLKMSGNTAVPGRMSECIVATTDKAGTFTFTAKAKGVKSASVKCTVK